MDHKTVHDKLVKVEHIGVVGPFGALGICSVIVKSADKKTVAIACEPQYGFSLSSVLNGDRTPYSDVADMIAAYDGEIVASKISSMEGMIYSSVLASNKTMKPLKISAGGPALAICLARASNTTLYMSNRLLQALPDCGAEYAAMQDRVHPLFPMQALTNTDDLKVACDLMDKTK